MIKKQRGFNLIEVLVAVVILSVGLLGIAGLQLGGVRGTMSSYYRSQAVSLANDMAERIYVNVPGANAGSYSAINSATLNCSGSPGNQCGSESGSAATSCTAAEMAAYDAFVVSCGYKKGGGGRAGGVTDLLPGGVITVRCENFASPVAYVTGANCLAGFRHLIQITWQERAETNSASGLFELAQQSVSITVQP